MTTNQTNNSVILCGTVKGEPVYSHEVFGEKFYEVMLAVKRLSGMDDVLPVSVSEHLLGDGFRDGCEVTVKGQFRSYNKIVGERSKLMLTVFVRDVEPFDPTVNPNTMQLSGFICKPPVYRTTPFNREICDLLVAVNRQYNKSDYIPCIVWGRNARFAEKLAVGQHIDIVGRVQSRNYQKRLDDDTVVTRTAYEVSVGKISIADDSAVSATETSESDVADDVTEVGELHAGIQIL
uniref:single-stranded DNA-binding protein n=1 Tax=Candidatus Fimenecus sp. TaxID=3022888 RepID=UPI004029AA90